jgi:hypothetical protein
LQRSSAELKGEKRPCAVVVLGAGRSGTSAITRGVHAIGVELGDDLRPGGGKNPTGFFEDQELLAINTRLKRVLGIRGDSVSLIAPERWQAPAVRALQKEAVETIRRRFGRYRLWGYKYGRTLRLLPFGLEVYEASDLDVRYVVALRNPISVARSRAKLEPRRGTQAKSDLEWLVNVVPYLRAIRERPFVVVDYDRVMEDPIGQLTRMTTALGLPLEDETRASIRKYAEDFLRPDMRHSRFTAQDLAQDERVNRLTREAYGWLDRLAADEIGPDAPEFWQAWEGIERQVAELGPILEHMDQVEADFRQAQRNPFGPLQLTPRLWRKLRGG